MVEICLFLWEQRAGFVQLLVKGLSVIPGSDLVSRAVSLAAGGGGNITAPLLWLAPQEGGLLRPGCVCVCVRAA